MEGTARCTLIFVPMLQHFSPYALQILRLVIWLSILTAIFAPLERLFALHPQSFFRKALVTDLSYYFLSSLVPAILLSMPLAVVARGVHGLIPAGYTLAVAALPVWLRATVALVVGEIGFYWGHRWSHQFPLLWRFHAIHHAPEHLTWLASSRAHPIDMVFTRFCGLTLLYLTGLASPMGGSASPYPRACDSVRHVLGFLHPRQSALALRASRMADRHSGLPSLASHQRRTGLHR